MGSGAYGRAVSDSRRSFSIAGYVAGSFGLGGRDWMIPARALPPSPEYVAMKFRKVSAACSSAWSLMIFQENNGTP